MKGMNPNSEFAEALRLRLEELGLSIRQLSEMTGFAYEHVRRVEKGLLMPSHRMCAAISETLHIETEKMWKLVISDKIREKYGTVPLEIAGRNPELEPIERVWHHLGSAEKQMLVDLVGVMAKRREATRSQSRRELQTNKSPKRKVLGSETTSVVGGIF